MLLLVTILLVLIAAVTLLIGIFSDNLALIFVSIGASALAAIVLAVLSQVSKRKGREATAAGPETLPVREPAADSGGRPAEAEAKKAAADLATLGEPVGGAAADEPTTTMSAVGGALPIADYDSLRVNEILPALADLDLDQLETVAQHEESHKNRTTVLNRIDDLMDELEAQEGDATPAVVDLTDDDDVAEGAVESIEAIGEPVVASAAGASSGFPIPDYDDLDEGELIARLEDLDADQLEAVADREEAGQNRDAVLDAIDDRLDILEGIVPAPAKAAAATKTATKAPAKTAAAKVPARKAPAKSAASSKKATPPTATRKAAAPAPVKKAATKASSSAAAKKATAPAKKTATKAAASKAPAKKAAATAAKATKKAATTAKKAAPVKKASAAKKATKR